MKDNILTLFIRCILYRAWYVYHNFFTHPFLIFGFLPSDIIHDYTYNKMINTENMKITKNTFKQVGLLFISVIFYILPFLFIGGGMCAILGFFFPFLYSTKYVLFTALGSFLLHFFTFSSESDSVFIVFHAWLVDGVIDFLEKVREKFGSSK